LTTPHRWGNSTSNPEEVQRAPSTIESSATTDDSKPGYDRCRSQDRPHSRRDHSRPRVLTEPPTRPLRTRRRSPTPTPHRSRVRRTCHNDLTERCGIAQPRSRSSNATAPVGFRFPPEVIMLAVRWYLRFGLSYRDLEELLAERGVEVNHVTLFRRAQRFTLLLEDGTPVPPCRRATLVRRRDLRQSRRRLALRLPSDRRAWPGHRRPRFQATRHHRGPRVLRERRRSLTVIPMRSSPVALPRWRT
jgi:hypothetical protein